MARWTPDPTFYPSPRLAMDAPSETLAYVALLEPDQRSRPDALGVVDLERGSDTYGSDRVDARNGESWRRAAPLRLERVQRGALPIRAAAACRASLPRRPRPEVVAHLRRRHQARSAHTEDRQDDRAGRADRKTGYSRPHTSHCGPDAIYMSALGGANGADGPGGIFRLDRERSSRSDLGAERGPQRCHTTSGGTSTRTRSCPASGPRLTWSRTASYPEKLLAGEYGHAMHIWDLRKRETPEDARRRSRAPDGARASPGTRSARRVGIRRRRRLDDDLSASIWHWYRDGRRVADP